MNTESQSRLVKILGFEMKVLVALVTDYVDWLGDCVSVIYQLASSIQRSDGLGSAGIGREATPSL